MSRPSKRASPIWAGIVGKREEILRRALAVVGDQPVHRATPTPNMAAVQYAAYCTNEPRRRAPHPVQALGEWRRGHEKTWPTKVVGDCRFSGRSPSSHRFTIRTMIMPLWDKRSARWRQKIYGADDATSDDKTCARSDRPLRGQDGYGHLPDLHGQDPVQLLHRCLTQRARPTGHTIPVREVRLSAGAEFVVAICGEIMTMPGCPGYPPPTAFS